MNCRPSSVLGRLAEVAIDLSAWRPVHARHSRSHPRSGCLVSRWQKRRRAGSHPHVGRPARVFDGIHGIVIPAVVDSAQYDVQRRAGSAKLGVPRNHRQSGLDGCPYREPDPARIIAAPCSKSPPAPTMTPFPNAIGGRPAIASSAFLDSSCPTSAESAMYSLRSASAGRDAAGLTRTAQATAHSAGGVTFRSACWTTSRMNTCVSRISNAFSFGTTDRIYFLAQRRERCGLRYPARMNRGKSSVALSRTNSGTSPITNSRSLEQIVVRPRLRIVVRPRLRTRTVVSPR